MREATGRHILVVDDEFHMANSIKFILSLENYRVSMAGNGREALDVLLRALKSANPVDLLVTDVWMPVMDGPSMLEELVKKGVRVPVLVITAMDIHKVRMDLAHFDSCDFMSKPFDDAELLEKVACIFEKYGAY